MCAAHWSVGQRVLLVPRFLCLLLGLLCILLRFSLRLVSVVLRFLLRHLRVLLSSACAFSRVVGAVEVDLVWTAREKKSSITRRMTRIYEKTRKVCFSCDSKLFECVLSEGLGDKNSGIDHEQVNSPQSYERLWPPRASQSPEAQCWDRPLSSSDRFSKLTSKSIFLDGSIQLVAGKSSSSIILDGGR